MAKISLTSPVGRIVMGSLYVPNTTDADGNPLVVKSGPNIGQPRSNYFFALAIPKNPGETHWANTAWGQQIWALGHQTFPQAAQAADFSWKIIDGDSQVPGKLFKGKPGKKPCENEGWPGHWVVKFSGGFAPKVYRQEGAGFVAAEPDFVKLGYFAEVNFEVEGNGSQSSPGVYINHRMVAFRAYGPEIVIGPDVTSAGFGQTPLPAGASMTPPPSAVPLPAAPQGVAPAPLAPVNAAYAPPVGVPYQAPAPVSTYATTASLSSPQPIPVSPQPQFLQVPPPGAVHPVVAAPPPVAPPPAPVRQMLPAANGVSYEQYIGAGWTDVLLVQNGMMAA